MEQPSIFIDARGSQELSVLFLVNPTDRHMGTEEEVASLCTNLAETVERTILYREHVNEGEILSRSGLKDIQILHYAGPFPVISDAGKPALSLADGAYLGQSALERLFQGFARHPFVFLSLHDDESTPRMIQQYAREEILERLADSLISAGAKAVLTTRWPISRLHMWEFAIRFYQDIADGVTLGEALQRARQALAQHYSGDSSWSSFMFYGDPTRQFVTALMPGIERVVVPSPCPLDESQFIPLPEPGVHGPDRGFLRVILELALDESRSMQKDYLGIPQLFIALTRLDGGYTQDALHRLGFSSRKVRDVVHMALGSGKMDDKTPILPTRRCKEVLLLAERNARSRGLPIIDERSLAQAVLSEGAGVTHALLTKLGIHPDQLLGLVMSSTSQSLLELAYSARTDFQEIAGHAFDPDKSARHE